MKSLIIVALLVISSGHLSLLFPFPPLTPLLFTVLKSTLAKVSPVRGRQSFPAGYAVFHTSSALESDGPCISAFGLLPLLLIV